MSEPLIRPIQPKDNAAVKQLVKDVLAEFVEGTDGFASADPELEDMYTAYAAPGHRYFVVEYQGQVRGIAGIAPLAGCDDKQVAELRKMYFHSSLRGQGLAHVLMRTCLDCAQEMGYRYIYLETLPHMNAAQSLYRKHGFKNIPERMGDTGHHGCPVFMLLDMETE